MNFFFLISSHLVPVSCKIQALDPLCGFCATLHHRNRSAWFLGSHLEPATYRALASGLKALTKMTAQLTGCKERCFYLPHCPLRF